MLYPSRNRLLTVRKRKASAFLLQIPHERMSGMSSAVLRCQLIYKTPISEQGIVMISTSELTLKWLESFSSDEQGSQVVEYALLIALVSIALAVALSSGGLDTSFGTLVDRVKACFSSSPTKC